MAKRKNDEPDIRQLALDLGAEPEGDLPTTLRERFIVPPFSVLDARSPHWQARKRAWINLGIQGELGRGEHLDKRSDQDRSE